MALLLLENVTIRFGGLTAVSDVSFAVDAKTIHGLIGPNGAGKTTLFNIITGLYTASAGRVCFDGNTISGLRLHEVTSRGISRTFQSVELVRGMSVREHILLGTQCRLRGSLPARLFRVMTGRHWAEEQQLVQLAEEVMEKMKLSHLADQPATSLPFGLQRRVELARAVASGPKLLLLDEPASGLNNKEKEELAEDLIDLVRNHGLTILIVEHDMNVVMQICDRITVLNYGKKIAEGTPREIQQNPAVIEAYLGQRRTSHRRPSPLEEPQQDDDARQDGVPRLSDG